MCASVLINSTNTYCPNVFQTLQPGAHKTRYNIVFYKVCSSHFPWSAHVGTLSTLRAVCGKVFQAESRKLVLSVYSSVSPCSAHVQSRTRTHTSRVIDKLNRLPKTHSSPKVWSIKRHTHIRECWRNRPTKTFPTWEKKYTPRKIAHRNNHLRTRH